MTSSQPSEPDKPVTPIAGPDVARAIMTASCTMIGMCATLLGLVKFVSPNKGFDTLVDECAAVVGLIFLGSAVLSYLAIRHAHRPRLSRYIERCADILFVMGLIGIAAAVPLLAFEFI